MGAKLYLRGICTEVSKLLHFLGNTFAGLIPHAAVLLSGGAVGSPSLGSPAGGGGRAVPPCVPPPVWQRASSVSLAALSSCSPSQARLGSSGRILGGAGAVCLSHSRALGSVSPLVSARAERKQLGCWRASSAPGQGRARRCLQKQTAAAPLLGLLALLCLSLQQIPDPRLAGSGAASPLLLKPKSRIPADFHGRGVYSREQHLPLHPGAPHPSPLRSELASQHHRRCHGHRPRHHRRGQERPGQ